MTTYAELRAGWLPRGDTCSLPWEYVYQVFIIGSTYHAVVPDYQRGRVWTTEQQALFVGAVLEDGPVVCAQPLTFQREPEIRGRSTRDVPDEIVDGQQRLHAVCQFMCGGLEARLPNGARMRFQDFTPEDRKRIGGLFFTIRYVGMPTRADVLRLYLRLNRTGTPHTDAEIERVRALLAKEQP